MVGRRARTWPDLLVRGGRDTVQSVSGLSVPGDKSITHRALLSALMTNSDCEVRGANLGGAVLSLLGPMAQLGFEVRRDRANLIVRRAGRPADPCPHLDVQGSSAAGRLLIGALAGLGTRAIVDGNSVLRNRPMEWVVEPLKELGARIEYLDRFGRLPVAVHSGITRSGRVELAVDSAQARSAVLTACVTAAIPVRIMRRVRTRDHTERLLAAMGADLRDDEDAVEYGGASIRPLPAIDVPGDPSLAAYLATTELLSPASGGLRIRDVCLNPTRLGFFEVLRRAGACISYQDTRQQAGEPVGTIVIEGGKNPLGAVKVSDHFTLHAMIDEVPLLAAVASHIPEASVISCAEELSFKETDRLTTTAQMLRSFGVTIEVTRSSLRVEGGAHPQPGAAESFDDHRIAMAAATLASSLNGPTLIRGGACHGTSFPGFTAAMRSLGVNITTCS